MKLNMLLGWVIGALDLASMVYSMIDFTPFILMVGISLTYIAIMIIKNRKLKKKKGELNGFSPLRKQMQGEECDWKAGRHHGKMVRMEKAVIEVGLVDEAQTESKEIEKIKITES